MEISTTNDQIKLCQKQYITNLLRKFNMENCTGASTPIADVKTLLESSSDDEVVEAPYRQVIGVLMYCATITRPDLMFTLSVLSRFNHRPLEKHWVAAKRVLRYLKRTIEYSISYNRANEVSINAFSDADFARDVQQRKSTSGTIVLVGGGPVVYPSKLQSIIAQS